MMPWQRWPGQMAEMLRRISSGRSRTAQLLNLLVLLSMLAISGPGIPQR